MHDALLECGVPAYLLWVPAYLLGVPAYIVVYCSHGVPVDPRFFVPRGVSGGIVCTSSKAVHFLTLDHRSTSTQTSVSQRFTSRAVEMIWIGACVTVCTSHSFDFLEFFL